MVTSTTRPRARHLALAAALMVPLATLAAALAAPAEVNEWLLTALRGICAQRPSHTIFVGGQPLALEARMFGIFVGFGGTVLLGWTDDGWRRTELPRGRVLVILLIGFAFLALDGVNATLSDRALPYLYAPSSEPRLISGLWGGMALAALSMPVMSTLFWRRGIRVARPLFARWQELARPALGLAIVAAAATFGAGNATWLSLLAALSVLGSFALVNAYAVVLFWQGPTQAQRWSDLSWATACGLSLAIAELVGLAALRAWAEATLGLTWGF